MTAGYSGTPLPKKLGVKEGSRLALLNAPESFAAAVGVLPPGVSVRERGGGEADVVQKFGLATGLVDTKICAIDQTWSGLRFSRRRNSKQ